MLAVYMCLVVSLLAPVVFTTNTLLTIDGKTYLNGQYEVVSRNNGNIRDNIVNGHAKGRNLKVVKDLSFEEKEALLNQLKISNDNLSLAENERLQKLESHKNIIDELYLQKYQRNFDHIQNENALKRQGQILSQNDSEEGKTSNVMFDQKSD